MFVRKPPYTLNQNEADIAARSKIGKAVGVMELLTTISKQFRAEAYCSSKSSINRIQNSSSGSYIASMNPICTNGFPAQHGNEDIGKDPDDRSDPQGLQQYGLNGFDI